MAETKQKTIKKSPRLKGLFYIFIILLVTVGILCSASLIYAQTYKGKIFSGVHIGSLDVGGKSASEASLLLDNNIDALLDTGFDFNINSLKISLPSTIFAPSDPDLARELIIFHQDEAINKAVAYGRNINLIAGVIEQINTLRGNTIIPIKVDLDQNELKKNIEDRLKPYLSEVQNAGYSFAWPTAATAGDTIRPEVIIVPEKTGTAFDEKKLFNDIERHLSLLQHELITINLSTITPDITLEEATNLKDDVINLLTNGPWLIKYDDREWPITPQELSQMIFLQKDDQNAAQIGFNGQTLDSFFTRIEFEVNQAPQNAKFAMENNRVIEFQGSSNGLQLNREETLLSMEDSFINQGRKEVAIITISTVPEIDTANINDLGIEEKLGTGVSNFRNSPSNRIKNIKNGARLLNGILIKPGEEFSLLAALRPFTQENGYLPELVIKGDKIVPEIGGGLCQIGTTTFRATMNSGLPITARSNHSLVVSYYNDPANGNPGTDATIYDPAPDFRFINNTPAYILFTTEINTETKELKFTFWGKNDGRKGYYSAPQVDRWIPTGPTREINTIDLAPDERRCQSRHPGADAHFTYTVEKNDGTKEDQVFTSHYRPLPEICLVGVATLPTEETAPPESTPDESIIE